jgi:hypothetical protein
MPRNSRLGYPVSGPRFEPRLATRPPYLMTESIGTCGAVSGGEARGSRKEGDRDCRDAESRGESRT